MRGYQVLVPKNGTNQKWRLLISPVCLYNQYKSQTSFDLKAFHEFILFSNQNAELHTVSNAPLRYNELFIKQLNRGCIIQFACMKCSKIFVVLVIVETMAHYSRLKELLK